jgi:hypothetical protein
MICLNVLSFYWFSLFFAVFLFQSRDFRWNLVESGTHWGHGPICKSTLVWWSLPELQDSQPLLASDGGMDQLWELLFVPQLGGKPREREKNEKRLNGLVPQRAEISWVFP